MLTFPSSLLPCFGISVLVILPPPSSTHYESLVLFPEIN
uniref:Uncharacterized protein n=1 Tax=Arundo donax TaxID=35708 RepID=A0A0A9FUN4_ARUDO